GIPYHPLVHGSEPPVQVVIHVRCFGALRRAFRAFLGVLLELHAKPGAVLICRAPLCNPLPDLAGPLGVTAIELVHQNSGDLKLPPIGLHPSSGLRRLGPGLPEALSTGSTHRESLRERPARLSLRAQLDFVVMLVTPYCRRLRGWSPTAHQKPPPQMHSEEPSAEALGSKSRT